MSDSVYTDSGDMHRVSFLLFHREVLVVLKWERMGFPVKQQIDAQLTVSCVFKIGREQ